MRELDKQGSISFRLGVFLASLSNMQRVGVVAVACAAAVGLVATGSFVVDYAHNLGRSGSPIDPRNIVVAAGNVMGYGSDFEYFMDNMSTEKDTWGGSSCSPNSFKSIYRPDGRAADDNELNAYFATLEGAGLARRVQTSDNAGITSMVYGQYQLIVLDKSLCNSWWDIF